jgi:hypothetical protein
MNLADRTNLHIDTFDVFAGLNDDLRGLRYIRSVRMIRRCWRSGVRDSDTEARRAGVRHGRFSVELRIFLRANLS